VVLVFFPFLINPRFYTWDKTAETFLGHFEIEKLPIMRIEALCVIIVQVGIFYLVGASLFNYACMYFGFGLMWSSLQYVHHYQAERDVIHGAFNLHTWKFLDLVWLNHNWHKTHHQLPTIPWFYLPTLAEESGTETLPLLPAYIRMWKGPVYAKEGMHKKFDGPVSN